MMLRLWIEFEQVIKGRHAINPARRQLQPASDGEENVTIEMTKDLLRRVQHFDQRIGPVMMALHRRVEHPASFVINWI
jgi:hypothetical protein